ncbi:MAG: hypothetical protein CMH57_02445 [Myxococcales bacterium]|nr:hypothetical protein [Myxococcales bacterium]
MYTLIIEDKNDHSIADEFSFSEGSFYIGRVEGNDIILPSSNVSRRHSRLFVRDGKCFIEDLNSSNGVYVDSQRIQGEHNLGSGAQIRIGDYYLYLEYNRADGEGQSDVVSTHIVSQDENAHKLIRIRDAFAGEEFVLSELHNSIGRTDENYILLNDQSISRRHAVIENNGLVYSMSDLGSSNGTSVNGRQVTGTVVLKEGDIVRFGNVEFTFVSNETPYDPNRYAAPAAAAVLPAGGGFNVALFAVVGVVLLCAFTSVVAIGAYFVINKDKPETTPQPEVAKQEPTDAEKVLQAIAKGTAQMGESKWERAIESFDEALAIDADNEKAKTLKEKAQTELKSQDLFNAGLELKGKGRYEDAKEKLEQVKSGTVKYETALKELKEINLLLANQYKTAGLEAYKKGDYDDARDNLIKSIKLKCDKEVSEHIKKSEQKMQRLRRKYGSFDPFRIPPKCE